MKGREGSGLNFNLAIYVRVFAIFGARVKILLAPKYCNFLMMSKSSEQVYYAVGKGKEVGIYGTWKECKNQIEGVANAKYRKFFSIKDAQEFVDFWKDYSSPSHEKPESSSLVSTQKNRGWSHSNGKVRKNLKKKPLLSSVKNWEHLNGKKRENCRRQSHGWFSKWDPPTSCTKTNSILGTEPNSGDKATLPPLHYTSPISSIKISPFYYKSNGTRNISSSHKPKECVEVVGNVKKSNLVDDVITQEPDFKFEIVKKTPNDTTDTPQICESIALTDSENVLPTKENIPPSSRNISISSEKISEVSKDVEVGLVPKKEIIETETNNETKVSQEEGQLSGNNEVCLGLLESILKLIVNQTSINSEDVKKTLLVLLQKVMPGTNISINPQMDVEENNGRTEEASNEETNFENNALEQQPPPATHPSPNIKVQEQPTVNFSSPFEGRVEQKNVDVLALTLRLDAFEKRFDCCLKEMGAITSEISNIKSEIREIKEAVGSGTPVKRGLHQTTLKFESPHRLEFSSPSRSFSTDKPNSSSPEKGRRNLKRKLSRSDSFKEDETDDILSRIKVEAVDYTSFSVDSDEYVEVYTDGACHSNGQKGAKAGIGIWWGDNHPLNVSEPVEGSQTNNAAEIQAARIAIELAIKAGLKKLKVCTDSEFLINCITKWIHKWKKNDWTLIDGGKVKNKKEFEKKRLKHIVVSTETKWRTVSRTKEPRSIRGSTHLRVKVKKRPFILDIEEASSETRRHIL